MAKIEQRYVQALFKSAKTKEESILFEKGLTLLKDAFNQNQQFKNMILNPCISNQEKEEVIISLEHDYCKNNTFKNFIELLIEEKRFNLINNIQQEYATIISNVSKELIITIVVAKKPDNNQIKQITDKYKKIYGFDKVKYTIDIDPTIIGGIKVIIGNKIYDSSLKTQLEEIF